jgi:Zincin-like metallopeptidase
LGQQRPGRADVRNAGRPRAAATQAREAAALWERLTQAAGADARDAIWQHPDLLPDADDLDEPAGFIDRVIGGDTGGYRRGDCRVRGPGPDGGAVDN